MRSDDEQLLKRQLDLCCHSCKCCDVFCGKKTPSHRVFCQHDEISPLFSVFSNTPVPLFSCRRFTFAFAQALTCGNVHWDRLLVSLLLCSAFSLSHPVSLSVDVTMHICCMAQAVASKSFGSVVLSALPSHAYLILDTEIRALSTTQSHDSTNTESDKYSQQQGARVRKTGRNYE